MANGLDEARVNRCQNTLSGASNGIALTHYRKPLHCPVKSFHGAVSHLLVLVRKQYKDGRDYDDGIKAAKEEMKTASQISEKSLQIYFQFFFFSQTYPLHEASGSPSNIFC